MQVLRYYLKQKKKSTKKAQEFASDKEPKPGHRVTSILVAILFIML